MKFKSLITNAAKRSLTSFTRDIQSLHTKDLEKQSFLLVATAKFILHLKTHFQKREDSRYIEKEEILGCCFCTLLSKFSKAHSIADALFYVRWFSETISEVLVIQNAI